MTVTSQINILNRVYFIIFIRNFASALWEGDQRLHVKKCEGMFFGAFISIYYPKVFISALSPLLFMEQSQGVPIMPSSRVD